MRFTMHWRSAVCGATSTNRRDQPPNRAAASNSHCQNELVLFQILMRLTNVQAAPDITINAEPIVGSFLLMPRDSLLALELHPTRKPFRARALLGAPRRQSPVRQCLPSPHVLA